MVIPKELAPPPVVRLTYSDYVLFPNDGNRHEIIDGRHYMNAAPNPRHQFASRHLQFQLFEQIELPGFGQVINAPIDVQFSECDVVQPDIVIVLSGNKIITPTKIKGVPDLVVEILSPSNRDYDLKLKRNLYEQAGVPEFWIVDPEERVVQQFQRSANGEFGEPVACIQQLRFVTSSCSATVDVSRIWG